MFQPEWLESLPAATRSNLVQKARTKSWSVTIFRAVFMVPPPRAQMPAAIQERVLQLGSYAWTRGKQRAMIIPIVHTTKFCCDILRIFLPRKFLLPSLIKPFHKHNTPRPPSCHRPPPSFFPLPSSLPLIRSRRAAGCETRPAHRGTPAAHGTGAAAGPRPVIPPGKGCHRAHRTTALVPFFYVKQSSKRDASWGCIFVYLSVMRLRLCVLRS